MSRRSLLIVDDEYGLAEMLRDMLCELDFEVALAINGRLALDALAAKRIDLVLTDMMMPVMDGYELAAAMRRSRRYKRIPIVLMTSLPLSVLPRLELFDGILRKPFTPEALLETLGEFKQLNGRDPLANKE